MKKIIRGMLLLLCISCLIGSASAAEVDCFTTYCFASEDFEAGEQGITGICLRELPDSGVGSVMLGSRMLRPGDVLTAEQTAQMTFCPVGTPVDREARIGYLPIGEDGVAPESVMTISIRGREDKPPMAEDSTLETYKNLQVGGRLKVKEPEEQTMTYTVVRQPKRGTVTIGEDGSFTYTPKKNKIGIDSFTYTASDPAGHVSREATVTVTILKPTDAAQYTDTAGKDCCFSAEWMKNTGIFVGENVGGNPCFSPEKPVTQGEFLTMLVKTLDLPAEEDTEVAGFEDAPQWLRPYLAAAIRSGLAAGLAHSDVFPAEAPMDGETAADLLCIALDAADADALSQQGIVLTEGPMTRGDAAQVLYQTYLLSGNSNRPTVVRQ